MRVSLRTVRAFCKICPTPDEVRGRAFGGSSAPLRNDCYINLKTTITKIITTNTPMMNPMLLPPLLNSFFQPIRFHTDLTPRMARPHLPVHQDALYFWKQIAVCSKQHSFEKGLRRDELGWDGDLCHDDRRDINSELQCEPIVLCAAGCCLKKMKSSLQQEPEKGGRLSPFRSLFRPLPGKGGGDVLAQGVRSRCGRHMFPHEVTEGVLDQRGLAATGTALQVRLHADRFLDAKLAIEVGVHQFHDRRAVVHRRILA